MMPLSALMIYSKALQSLGDKSAYIIPHHHDQHTIIFNKSLLSKWISTFLLLNMKNIISCYLATFIKNIWCQNIQVKRTKKKSAENLDYFSWAAKRVLGSLLSKTIPTNMRQFIFKFNNTEKSVAQLSYPMSSIQ